MAKNKSNRVKEWMAKRSFNQSEIAKKLGISTSYLSLIANGKRNPNLRLSTKIANTLDVELLDLFPQNSDENTTFLDVIVGCMQKNDGIEELVSEISNAGFKCELVQGEFDLGYMTSVHRPNILILSADLISISLANLSQRLAIEPLTSHVKILPLVGTQGEIAERRKMQIKKIGLDPCEWDAQNHQIVVEFVTSALKAANK